MSLRGFFLFGWTPIKTGMTVSPYNETSLANARKPLREPPWVHPPSPPLFITDRFQKYVGCSLRHMGPAIAAS